jgi:hypothetical protein
MKKWSVAFIVPTILLWIRRRLIDARMEVEYRNNVKRLNALAERK